MAVIEVVGTQVLVGGTVLQQVIGDYQNSVAYCDGGHTILVIAYHLLKGGALTRV